MMRLGLLLGERAMSPSQQTQTDTENPETMKGQGEGAVPRSKKVGLEVGRSSDPNLELDNLSESK